MPLDPAEAGIHFSNQSAMADDATVIGRNLLPERRDLITGILTQICKLLPDRSKLPIHVGEFPAHIRELPVNLLLEFPQAGQDVAQQCQYLTHIRAVGLAHPWPPLHAQRIMLRRSGE
ncbi:MAG TPA: hypothetical protein VLI93_17420 [Acetobacteraceae bacterium]|nr:hypothetical protein [Acetobacteraceae bacterium]